MSWKKTLAASLAAALLFTAGCDKDSTQPSSEAGAPSLPPASSMHLDLGFFQQGSLDPEAAQQGEQLTKFNWTIAAITALWVDVHVAAILTPPFLAFGAAIHTIPSYQEDGSYLWIYTWVDPSGNEEVEIRLRGRVEGDHVRWELRVTNENADPPLDRTLWFWGESKLDENAGFWVFNDLGQPDFPEVARIHWYVAAEDDQELAIEVTGEGHEDEGDNLTYKIDGSDASMVLEDVSEEATVEIRWDTVTGTGSFLSPGYNGGNRACWDENQEDTVCPEDAPAS